MLALWKGAHIKNIPTASTWRVVGPQEKQRAGICSLGKYAIPGESDVVRQLG